MCEDIDIRDSLKFNVFKARENTLKQVSLRFKLVWFCHAVHFEIIHSHVLLQRCTQS